MINVIGALCAICLTPTGRELSPEQQDYCDKHSVTRGYWQFWREWRVDSNKIPDIEGLKEALLRALRVAACLPAEGVHEPQGPLTK